jgi:hypothetical protein
MHRAEMELVLHINDRWVQGMRIKAKQRVAEKPAPVNICQSNIAHQLLWDQKWVTMSETRRLALEMWYNQTNTY